MRLPEIDYIRATIIMVLVGYHCLAPYCGAWELPSEYNSTALFWLGKFLYNGMLETFVFISGYLFAASCERKGIPRFWTLLRNKTKRLYIPCLCWGVIMTVLFHNDNNLTETILSIANGRNHLWFLPMLLWCFIWEYIILKIQIQGLYVVAVLAVVAVLPYFGLPLQLNTSLYYLFFFHMGKMVFAHSERLRKHLKYRSLLISGG